MLESLRAIQNTRAGKTILGVVMGLIMVSFVIWGIGPVFTGFNANQIASVGSTSVTVEQFRQAYQSELQQLQQRARRPITNAQAHQYGIDTQVLSRLISEAMLDNQANGMGLVISQDQIAQQILADPAFKGPDGKFDRNQFNAILRDNEMNEQMFVRQQRNVYLRQQLVQGLVGAVATPKTAMDALHRFDAETRSVDYIVLPPSAAGTPPQPDDAALQKYYDERATTFRAPEFRKLVILPLTPATLAKPAEVAEADVAKLYDAVKAQRFSTPEYRTLQQIVFPSEAEAAAASSRIRAGASFADIATERKLGEKDTDLGRVTRASLFDKAVADAAFGLPEGAVSDPVKNAFGATLLHVVKIEPASTTPLDDVAAQLRTEIAASRTGEAIRTLHDKIEDARSSGQTLTEAGKAAGVEARTIEAVDAGGRDKSGKPVADLPDAPDLLKAAFASDIGVDNDTVRTPDGGQIFYEVAAIDPARPQTFAEVKPQVEAAWQQAETAKLLSGKAAEIVGRLKDGTSLEQVAASLGNLPVLHSADVRRQGGTGLDAATVAQVFDGPVGTIGSAPGDARTRVVFKVLGSVVPPLDPDAPQTGQIDSQYQTWLAEDMLSGYLNELQAKVGVKVNPQAFQAAIGSQS